MSKKIPSDELIDSLTDDVNHMIKVARSFTEESEEYLRKSPAEDKWNAMECLRHLNLTAEKYIPLMEAKVTRALGEQQKPAGWFKPHWFGNMATNSMKPREDGSIKRRMKTFDAINPRKVQRGNKELSTFLIYQNRLLNLLENSREIDLNKNKVRSPLMKIARFKFGDALRFVIAHEQRHIQQAIRTINQVKNN